MWGLWQGKATAATIAALLRAIGGFKEREPDLASEMLSAFTAIEPEAAPHDYTEDESLMRRLAV